MVRAVLAAAVLALAGCGGAPDLPEPGTPGGTLRLWRGDGPPILIVTGQVRQVAREQGRLRFHDLRAWMPLSHGMALIEASAGTADGSADDRVRIAPGQGPILVSGIDDGVPLVAVAQAGTIRDGDAALVLERVEMLAGGRRLVTARLDLPEAFGDRRLLLATGSGGVEAGPAPALIAAALGALPAGLEFQPATSP